MKTVSAYEIIDHGVEHEQFFQGCGISFTRFSDIATGMGNNAREALGDALEQLACNDWAVDDLEMRLKESSDDFGGWDDCKVKPDDSEDCHYYLSVRVK